MKTFLLTKTLALTVAIHPATLMCLGYDKPPNSDPNSNPNVDPNPGSTTVPALKGTRTLALIVVLKAPFVFPAKDSKLNFIIASGGSDRRGQG